MKKSFKLFFSLIAIFAIISISVSCYLVPEDEDPEIVTPGDDIDGPSVDPADDPSVTPEDPGTAPDPTEPGEDGGEPGTEGGEGGDLDPEEQGDGPADPPEPEKPEVDLTKKLVDITGCDEGPFSISSTEVTYEEWYSVYSWAIENGYSFANPGREGSTGKDGAKPTENKNQPVCNICWFDAVVWCNAASEKYGLDALYDYKGQCIKSSIESDLDLIYLVVYIDSNGFRLPTATEWKYAAKGGEETLYSGGDDINKVGWYATNSDKKTHNVAELTENGYKLFDMSGNVFEFCCADSRSSASTPFTFGGSYNMGASSCTVTSTFPVPSPALAISMSGFRLASTKGVEYWW